jgi:hypothetical protein
LLATDPVVQRGREAFPRLAELLASPPK